MLRKTSTLLIIAAVATNNLVAVNAFAKPASTQNRLSSKLNARSFPSQRQNFFGSFKKPGEETSSEPGLIEAANQSFQTWALRHPRFNPIGTLGIPIIRLTERIQISTSTTHEYFYHKRLVFGDNFCSQGCVWMSDFDEVDRALTSPQARTNNLGALVLDKAKIPDKTSPHGRLNFLLALSDQGAGGNGDREAFRAALEDTIFKTEDTARRQSDATAKALLQTLVNDYKEMGHTKGFFEDNRRGLKAYLMKYLHYVIYGLDPSDAAKIETLTQFHYDGQSAAYYLKFFNKLLGLKFQKWPQWAQDAAKIYEESPVISQFLESNPKYNDMTKREMAYLMESITAIAALVGPYTLAIQAMGAPNQRFPQYEGQATSEIDVTKIWDELDLENRDDAINFMFEVGRLKLPVATTHRVATEEFTVPIRGRNTTFPKGTKIIVPMCLSMVDDSFWGPTTFQFDHNRKNLCPFSMMFNSVGDRDAGRICPGREITLKMLSDVLIEVGKVRRQEASAVPTCIESKRDEALIH